MVDQTQDEILEVQTKNKQISKNGTQRMYRDGQKEGGKREPEPGHDEASRRHRFCPCVHWRLKP